MAALPPVAWTKSQAASTFGPIEPSGKLMARSSAQGRVTKWPSHWGPVVDLDPGDVSENQQDIGSELGGEQPRRAVLVDDRLHPAESAVGISDDRNPATTTTDDPDPHERSCSSTGSSTISRGRGEAPRAANRPRQP